MIFFNARESTINHFFCSNSYKCYYTFSFPSCDNFLHLTLYFKFLAFLLVKTIYKKSKLLKFPTWNHFSGRHLLKMVRKEQHDGSHHYLSRFISLHHSVVHPPSRWQFQKLTTPCSPRSRNTHSFCHLHLWLGSFSSPGSRTGLGSFSFCWYPRLTKWPLGAPSSVLWDSRGKVSWVQLCFPGLVHCLGHRRQCTITKWIKEWLNEASTSKESYKINKGKLTFDQKRGKDNAMDWIVTPDVTVFEERAFQEISKLNEVINLIVLVSL